MPGVRWTTTRLRGRCEQPSTRSTPFSSSTSTRILRAKRRGVTVVPSFVRDVTATITGYTTPDVLLVALGLKAESVVERPAIPVTPPTADTPTPHPTVTTGDRIDRLTGLVSTGLSVAGWLGLTGATVALPVL